MAEADIQTDIANKKKELGKQTTQVKTRQKEIQTIELELRELKRHCETGRQADPYRTDGQ